MASKAYNNEPEAYFSYLQGKIWEKKIIKLWSKTVIIYVKENGTKPHVPPQHMLYILVNKVDLVL